MRRFSFVIACGFLAACTHATGPDPRELLERTAAEHQRLASAKISYSFAMNGKQGDPLQSIEVHGEGALQNGGQRASADFEGGLSLRGIPAEISGRLVRSDGETFIRIDSLSVAGGAFEQSMPPQITGFLSRWWLLPSQGAPTGHAEPDPGVIPLQLRALDVVHDGGLVERDGMRVRELQVRLNRQRLAEFLRTAAEQRGEDAESVAAGSYDAEGTLWILQDTALLYDATWSLTPTDPLRPNVTVHLSLREPGAEVRVEKPADALPLLPGVQPFMTFMDGLETAPTDTMDSDSLR